MKDKQGRKIDYMRISITDRCNLRCQYCMPDDIELVDHEMILRFEEILRVCRVASELGITKFKITGGEPLVRRECMDLIRQIKELPLVEQVTITTNGVLLKDYLPELKDMSIDGINISLDTLDSEAYKRITGRDELETVMSAIKEAVEMGLPIKINCVPIKEMIQTDIMDMVELATKIPVDIRFIEIMPLGLGEKFTSISRQEIIDQIKERYPNANWTNKKRGNGPASYLSDNNWLGNVGFIDAINHKFCNSCNRIRLTSTGFLKACLCFQNGIDLRKELRGNTDDKRLKYLIKQTIDQKPIEHRLESKDRDSESRFMSQIGG